MYRSIAFRRLSTYALAALVVTLVFANHNLSADEDFHKTVDLWFGAFIPSTDEGRADYIVPTSDGTHVVQAPPFLTLKGTCFSTDNRSFDSSTKASSRVFIKIRLIINGADMTTATAVERRVGPTHNVDCKTGKDLQPPKTAISDTLVVHDVVKANFARTLYLEAASANPFFPSVQVPGTHMSLGISPDIDFKISIRYDFLARKMVLNGTVGYFPAFEAYYSLNDGPVKTIYQLGPYKDSTAWSLVDFSSGINTRNVGKTIDLN